MTRKIKRPPDTRATALAEHANKSFLRFLTCGSVDDGKSTLIGRLLYDTKLLLEDQLTALERDSARIGKSEDELDFALLVDGLEAEREQGITIDVAYRFFATAKRKFIVADTPGHEQYTRNMATGASTADLAVILVDARKGILPQTRRHFYIASLLGIRHFVLAINKIDLVGYSRSAFTDILQDFSSYSSKLQATAVTAIPLSARLGDNVTARGDKLDWYEGPTLLEHLESVEVAQDLTAQPFRMPVQWINRPNPDFRGYSGTIAAGTITPGSAITIAGSGISTRLRSITSFDGNLEVASAGDAVTLVMEDEVDISRGDLLSEPSALPEVADQFAAHLIWMNEEPMVPGRLYVFRTASKSVIGSFTEVKHLIEISDLQHTAAKSVGMNDIGFVNASLREAIAFDPYQVNHQTGSFIVIDRLTNLTVGAGLISFALRRASNLHWQEITLSKSVRGKSLGQSPGVIWFTGLSGAGKSTIANLLEQRLFALGCHTYLLDGDNVRHGLNRDLGFTEADRVENIRRVAEVARLFVDAGMVVLVSLISPYRSERQMARELFEDGEFVEVFVDTPVEIAEKRDPKGLYKKARAGKVKNFTGVDSPYEVPECPELRLDAGRRSPESLVADIVDYLLARWASPPERF